MQGSMGGQTSQGTKVGGETGNGGLLSQAVCAWKSALSEFQSWDFTTRRRCSLASPALLEGDPDSTAKHLEPVVNSVQPQPPDCRGD